MTEQTTFELLGKVLHLDRVRTTFFIYRLRRLLQKHGFTSDEVEDVVRFAMNIRYMERME